MRASEPAAARAPAPAENRLERSVAPSGIPAARLLFQLWNNGGWCAVHGRRRVDGGACLSGRGETLRGRRAAAPPAPPPPLPLSAARADSLIALRQPSWRWRTREAWCWARTRARARVRDLTAPGRRRRRWCCSWLSLALRAAARLVHRQPLRGQDQQPVRERVHLPLRLGARPSPARPPRACLPRVAPCVQRSPAAAAQHERAAALSERAPVPGAVNPRPEPLLRRLRTHRPSQRS